MQQLFIDKKALTTTYEQAQMGMDKVFDMIDLHAWAESDITEARNHFLRAALALGAMPGDLDDPVFLEGN